MQECAGAASAGAGSGAGCGLCRNRAFRRSEWGQAPSKHVHERQKQSQNRRFVTLVYTISVSSHAIGMVRYRHGSLFSATLHLFGLWR